jgi:hypothetical protein
MPTLADIAWGELAEMGLFVLGLLSVPAVASAIKHLKEIARGIGGIPATVEKVAQNTGHIDQHERRLTEHGQTLQEHGERLNKHGLKIAEMESWKGKPIDPAQSA